MVFWICNLDELRAVAVDDGQDVGVALRLLVAIGTALDYREVALVEFDGGHTLAFVGADGEYEAICFVEV